MKDLLFVKKMHLPIFSPHKPENVTNKNWVSTKTTAIRAKVIYIEGNMSNMIFLNGRNYNIWKSKMKDLLFVKKMHLPVFSAHKPENVTDENWKFEHQQVCGYIRQWVEDNVLNHIVNETHARTL